MSNFLASDFFSSFLVLCLTLGGHHHFINVDTKKEQLHVIPSRYTF